MEIADVQPVAPPPLSSNLSQKRGLRSGEDWKRKWVFQETMGLKTWGALTWSIVRTEEEGKKEPKGRRIEYTHLSLFLTNNRELQQAQELLQEKKRKAAPSPESLSVKRLNKSFQRIFIFLWRLFGLAVSSIYFKQSLFYLYDPVKQTTYLINPTNTFLPCSYRLLLFFLLSIYICECINLCM